MRIAFFGTPDFAIPSLRAIRKKVVCIVTQPDKPIGRGGKVQYSAVKKFGLEHKIPVLQPEKISKELEILDKYKIDLIVTCAFGQMLKQNVLNYCKYGVINVHGSILPKYRGSSPIQWAIIKGETKTGVTIMHTDIGMDTGDMILVKELEIGAEETAGELFERMAELGAKALVEVLKQIKKGTNTRTPQNHDEATKYPMLNKETAKIDFENMMAVEVVNWVRGMNPWPVAWCIHDDKVVRVFKASVGDKGLVKKCKDGSVQLDIIQLEGGKVLPTRDYINGRKIQL